MNAELRDIRGRPEEMPKMEDPGIFEAFIIDFINLETRDRLENRGSFDFFCFA